MIKNRFVGRKIFACLAVGLFAVWSALLRHKSLELPSEPAPFQHFAALCQTDEAQAAQAGILDLHSFALEAAGFNALEPALILAVIAAESSCLADARSHAGALGPMQLMPATAAELGVPDALSPRDNIFGGARYLASLIDRFGSVELALAAYNAGPGTVRRYNGVPPYPETKRYIKTVLDNYQTLKVQLEPA